VLGVVLNMLHACWWRQQLQPCHITCTWRSHTCATDVLQAKTVVRVRSCDCSAAGKVCDTCDL
jgi:hypothetical protein